MALHSRIPAFPKCGLRDCPKPQKMAGTAIARKNHDVLPPLFQVSKLKLQVAAVSGARALGSDCSEAKPNGANLPGGITAELSQRETSWQNLDLAQRM